MPHSYLETLLMRDEQVIYAARLHWIGYMPGIITTALGWAFAHYGTVPLVYRLTGYVLPYPQFHYMLNYVVMAMVVFGVLMLLGAYLRTTRTELAVTNRRVLAKFGIWSRTTVELFLTKVEGANVEQGVTGRILGYGSIHVRGTGAGMTPIDNIANPEVFQRVLLEQIRRRHENTHTDTNGIDD